MTDYTLDHGSHQTAEDGKCAMEWVAFLAGEKHSDSPVCVSPMLTQFCILLNDWLPADQRQRMRPYLARTIGTRGDGLDDDRQWMCADWLFREYLPAWLDLSPALKGHATTLRDLPPVLATENVQRLMGDLSRIRQDAGAAWAAAGDAAWAAAGAAARDAARDAARAAARAAAWAAAWAAAGDAAWAAAGAAARDALAPTVLVLQDSVLSPGGLLDRMLPLEPVQIPAVGDWREVCALEAV